MKIFIKIFFLSFLSILIFIKFIFSNPIGWENKVYLVPKVYKASFFQDSTLKTNSIYFVTMHLNSKFNKNKKTKILLKVHKYNGSTLYSKNLTTVTLEQSNILFPLHPTIAVAHKKTYVVWQETSLNQDKTILKYMVSSNGFENFSQPQKITVHSNIAVLPQLKIDSNRKFHLFYQAEQENGKFNLMHSTVINNQFSSPIPVIKNINLIGQGVFSPSIIFYQNRCYIFYQNRFKNNYRDEIFYVISHDNGNSFSSAKQLTKNKTNDFSPKGAIVNGNIEWVWQGNQNKTWSIFYANQSNTPRIINESSAHAYMPQLQSSSKTGRIIVWYDFRENPAQIYSKFIDKKENRYIGKDFNVTQERRKARDPVLIKVKNNIYLFYISRGILYSKKVDNDTQFIPIQSSHPQGKAIRNNKVSFHWKKPKDASGVLDYAYIINQEVNTIPEIYNLNSSSTSVSTNLAGGNYYFHFKYRDKAGNESKVIHYNFIIDNSPPTAPIIESKTHQSGLPSSNSNVIFHFSSNDDSAIDYYQYTFSRNRVKKLNKRTKKQTLIFNNNKPGLYYFKIQAVDLAGNKSDVSLFKIQIEAKDSDHLKLFCSITDGKVKKDFLNCDFIVMGSYNIQKIKAIVDEKEQNPFHIKEYIPFTKNNKKYSFSIPISKLSKGIYVLSIGAIFADNSKSQIRTRNFEKVSKNNIFSKNDNQNKNIIFKKRNININTIKNTNYQKLKTKNILISTLIPQIIINKTGSLYEVFFKIEKKYKPFLKGFSWHLTDKPELPDNLVDSLGGPEYIYNLQKGNYYLTVKPILKKQLLKKIRKNERNKIYANKIIKIKLVQKEITYLTIILLTVSLLFIVFILFYNRHKIRFYLSKYIH